VIGAVDLTDKMILAANAGLITKVDNDSAAVGLDWSLSLSRRPICLYSFVWLLAADSARFLRKLADFSIRKRRIGDN
jgi:hypothetical protein